MRDWIVGFTFESVTSWHPIRGTTAQVCGSRRSRLETRKTETRLSTVKVPVAPGAPTSESEGVIRTTTVGRGARRATLSRREAQTYVCAVPPGEDTSPEIPS